MRRLTGGRLRANDSFEVMLGIDCSPEQHSVGSLQMAFAETNKPVLLGTDHRMSNLATIERAALCVSADHLAALEEFALTGFSEFQRFWSNCFLTVRNEVERLHLQQQFFCDHRDSQCTSHPPLKCVHDVLQSRLRAI